MTHATSQTAARPASPFRQPKAVFAVAFACVVSFMGIGLVDPILPAISHQLHASPSQVTLLFTSYLVVTAVAMLITGWVSSRIGAKRTLVAGLVLIVIFATLAGAAPDIAGIIGFRAGWGVGNALFIATSLAVIVASASGGFVGAIVLYETALGLGIAIGPLLGGLLGTVSWRGPFFGVAALMAIALVATLVLVEPLPRPARPMGLSEPLRALRHRGLLTVSLTALCYNWGFFTMLGYAPFPMNLSPIKLGLVFTGWGVLVAFFAVFGAPRLQARFGIAPTLYANLLLFAATLVVIGAWTTHRPVLITAVIVAGIFVGVNNTITTQAVMTISPVERPVASAAYGFVRFIGGGLAPYVAGRLAADVNVHVPFYIGAGTLVLAAVILTTARRQLGEAERAQAAAAGVTDDGAEVITIGGGEAGAPVPTAPVTAGRFVAVGAPTAASGNGMDTTGVLVAAIDSSPTAEQVVAAAGRLATLHHRTVHLLHVQEGAVTEEGAIDAEDLGVIRSQVSRHLDYLATEGVPAVGHILLHAPGHGAVGRMIADYAEARRAAAIVVGAPTHGGLPVLMDESATEELWHHAPSHLVIINAEGLRRPQPAAI